MAGVASVLVGSDLERVSSLWALLDDELGLKRVAISPIPHLTYQASHKYDIDLLVRIAEDLATKLRPVRVLADGIAVFPGERPIVYIPAVRTPELSRFQLAVWSAASVAASGGLDDYLHPSKWIPHVTLAQGDVTRENVGRIVELLNDQPLEWELSLDNLSVIRGKGPDRPQELVSTNALRGVPRNF